MGSFLLRFSKHFLVLTLFRLLEPSPSAPVAYHVAGRGLEPLLRQKFLQELIRKFLWQLAEIVYCMVRLSFALGRNLLESLAPPLQHITQDVVGTSQIGLPNQFPDFLLAFLPPQPCIALA